MVGIHYRWDFIGLSTDTKPTPETSEKVVNGSTFYCSDNSKLYVFCDGTWYERKPLGGGSYVAGTGIDITDDTISVDTETIQTKLTAGNNITISDGTISATDTTYSAGSNITISDNTISATDTTYSNFVGTDGTAAGTAGLVPAPATTDAGKFLKADGTWDTAGGGSGPTVVQTTGTSTTDVMSQNATTSMVFADPSTKYRVQIGAGASTNADTISIGHEAHSNGWFATALGAYKTSANYRGSTALGSFAAAMEIGEMNIGLPLATGIQQRDYGYRQSAYRLLTGLYDGQSDHDAATVGQIKMGVLSTTPTGTTVGFPGRLYTYDSGGGTYEVYLCVHDNGDNTYVWKQVSLI